MAEYHFKRYRQGVEMAEGVIVTRAKSFDDACKYASRMAANYRDGTTLVYAPDATTIETLAAALEEVERWWLVEGKHVFLGAPHAMFAARAALKKLKEG